MTNRRAMVRVPRTCESDFADLSCVECSDGLNDPGPAAPLVAHLHDSLMLAGGGYHELAFVQIMAAGLFDIHMFSCGAGKDCGWRVPVVRRRDRHRVHGGVVEDSPKILYPLRFSGLLLANRGDAFLDRPVVYVAHVCNLRVWL